MQPAARALHAHRFLMRLGLGMAGTFLWIFLFEFFFLIAGNMGRAMIGVAIVYGVVQGVAMLLTPISAAHLRRGVRPAMLAGTLLLASSFVALGALLSGDFGERPLLWGVLFFAVLYGGYRALYWVPYRMQEALEGEPVRFVFEFLIALMPAIAGALIALSPDGYLRILFGAAAFVIVSLIPIATLPDIRESHGWHYIESFAQLMRPQHRALVLHGLFDGMQGAALFLVWPLAVFLIVGASYLWLGVVMSTTLVVLLALRRPLQAVLKRLGLLDSDAVRLTVAVSGWIFRLAAGSPFAVVFADSYAHLGAPRGASIDAHSFEQSADASTFIDEYSTLKELALASGRLLLTAVFALLVYSAPLPTALVVTLVIASLASGGTVLLSKRLRLSV